VQHLRQEHPQGDAWRIKAFAINYLQFVEQSEQALLAQYLREGKGGRLVILIPQLGDLAEKACGDHDGPPCRWVSDVIPF
jgi:hypothetical protein